MAYGNYISGDPKSGSMSLIISGVLMVRWRGHEQEFLSRRILGRLCLLFIEMSQRMIFTL